MKRVNKLALLSLVFSAIAATHLVANPQQDNDRACTSCNTICNIKKKRCPVGTWNVNARIAKFLPAFCVMTFHDDHTVDLNTFLDSFNIPDGFDGPGCEEQIIALGCWKQIGRDLFKVVTSGVFKVSSLFSQNNGLFPKFLREKAVFVVRVSKDCKTFTFEGDKTFFNVHDICLEDPFKIFGKVIKIPFDGEGCKVKCKRRKDHNDSD